MSAASRSGPATITRPRDATGWVGYRSRPSCRVQSFLPFARTKAERQARGDPRPSIEERYPSHAAYVAAEDLPAEHQAKPVRIWLDRGTCRFARLAG